MSERDEKGRFVKGNNFGCMKSSKENQLLKKATKSEIIQAASLVTMNYADFMNIPEETMSVLGATLKQRLKVGDTKYLQWLIEHAIGKPGITIENNNSDVDKIQINYVKAEVKKG